MDELKNRWKQDNCEILQYVPSNYDSCRIEIMCKGCVDLSVLGDALSSIKQIRTAPSEATSSYYSAPYVGTMQPCPRSVYVNANLRSLRGLDKFIELLDTNVLGNIDILGSPYLEVVEGFSSDASDGGIGFSKEVSGYVRIKNNPNLRSLEGLNIGMP